MNVKKREFIIVLDVEDQEAPEETHEQAANAMQSFILEALQSLQMDVINIHVVCK